MMMMSVDSPSAAQDSRYWNEGTPCIMGASRSPSPADVVTRLSDIATEDLAILQFEALGCRETIKKTESIESRAFNGLNLLHESLSNLLHPSHCHLSISHAFANLKTPVAPASLADLSDSSKEELGILRTPRSREKHERRHGRFARSWSPEEVTRTAWKPITRSAYDKMRDGLLYLRTRSWAAPQSPSAASPHSKGGLRSSGSSYRCTLCDCFFPSPLSQQDDDYQSWDPAVDMSSMRSYKPPAPAPAAAGG